MKTILALTAVTLTAAIATTSAKADDRPATPAERAAIADVLRANGYISWRKIEFDRDDRKFEVDDARHENGRVYDVDIRNGRIIKRERD